MESHLATEVFLWPQEGIKAALLSMSLNPCSLSFVRLSTIARVWKIFTIIISLGFS